MENDGSVAKTAIWKITFSCLLAFFPGSRFVSLRGILQLFLRLTIKYVAKLFSFIERIHQQREITKPEKMFGSNKNKYAIDLLLRLEDKFLCIFFLCCFLAGIGFVWLCFMNKARRSYSILTKYVDNYSLQDLTSNSQHG